MSSDSALSLRISTRDRDLIDRGAEATGKSRTEFMLDASRTAATDALLDRRLFLLEPMEFAAFERALAKAPLASELARKIRQKLTKRSPPWTA